MARRGGRSGVRSAPMNLEPQKTSEIRAGSGVARVMASLAILALAALAILVVLEIIPARPLPKSPARPP